MSADQAPARAWLMLAVGDERQHGGNDGYDDEPSSHYSWDDTVPNHAAVQVGDALVLWDNKFLIGASVAAEIRTRRVSKKFHFCPRCGKTGFKPRKTMAPRFRCSKCGDEFDKPRSVRRRVTSFRSEHSAAWVDLRECLPGSRLRALCESPGSQLSIRPLRWRRFTAALLAEDPTLNLTAMNFRPGRLPGGHRTGTVRVRVGQGRFRQLLLDRFGENCAFTGRAPLRTLEAGHLYSYADLDQHHSSGGLMLRRDIHSLFDLGELTVNPETLRIDARPSLMEFPAYAVLHDTPLQVQLDGGHREWLGEHWNLHR